MSANSTGDKAAPQRDFEAFLSELKAPWKTMQHDMQTVYQIIDAQRDFSDESVPFLESSWQQGELEMGFPQWHDQAEETFIAQYGQQHGKLIYNKVVMRLFQLAKGSQTALH